MQSMSISDNTQNRTDPFLAPRSSRKRVKKGSKALREAWGTLNPDYWRHGITISQGNGWPVTQKQAQKVLSYIAPRLLRGVFGNRWRQKKARVCFLGFRQGSMECGTQHWHVLLGIEGEHNWSDGDIASKIEQIDRVRPKKRWEKPLHMDWNWQWGNAFHRYVTSEIGLDLDLSPVSTPRYGHENKTKFDSDRYYFFEID
jgi:hypothetical protein